MFERNKYELSGKEVKEILTNANEPVEEETENKYASFIEKIEKLNFGYLMAMFKHIERKIDDLVDIRSNYLEEISKLDKTDKVPEYPKEIEEMNALRIQKTLICVEMSRRMKEKYQVEEDEQTL